MQLLYVFSGAVLIVGILWEGFETIVLPRRVTRRVRATRIFYRLSWRPWRQASRFFCGRRQDTFLSVFGPLSLICLLSLWAAGLITGFALLHLGAGAGLRTPEGIAGFRECLYLSGTTFFTLGLGDITPMSSTARLMTVVESGLGFGFLALVIGYIPALTTSFSQREVNISLLDARAGSPPTACEMLCRHAEGPGRDALQQLLHEWERWSSELLESHLSYPVLAYFRSQHDNQSWLGALTAILDACALLQIVEQGAVRRQAQLTFAMARHAVSDLALVFMTPPREPREDRLGPEVLAALRTRFASEGIPFPDGAETFAVLEDLRGMYEPCILSLSRYLAMPLPQWVPMTEARDNWQSAPWGKDRTDSAPALWHDPRHF